MNFCIKCRLIYLSKYWFTSSSDCLRPGKSGHRIPGWGRYFPYVSTAFLGANQPPVQWPPALSTGRKGFGAWCWQPSAFWRRVYEWVETVPPPPLCASISVSRGALISISNTTRSQFCSQGREQKDFGSISHILVAINTIMGIIYATLYPTVNRTFVVRLM